jgi:phenylpyruvate tautomerase PptA (4-oxalocrotonate tautomerase family)
MPMIDVYAAAGTFPDPQALAQELAAVVMRWEQVPDLPLFATNTAAFIHEMDEAAISNVAGKSDYVRVQVLTPVGVLDCDKQLGVVKELTDIVAAAAGDPRLRERTWVLPTDSPEGGWGTGGHAKTNADITAAADASRGVARVVSDVSVLCPRSVAVCDNSAGAVWAPWPRSPTSQLLLEARARVALTATRIAVRCSEQSGFPVYIDSDRVRVGESAASCSSVWSISRGDVPGPLSMRVAAGRGQRTARMVGRDRSERAACAIAGHRSWVSLRLKNGRVHELAFRDVAVAELAVDGENGRLRRPER